MEHYSFADKHFIYDMNSDDRTVEIALKNPKVVVYSFKDNTFNDNNNIWIKKNCWLGTDADWAIVGDVDEFLFHPNLIDLLSNTSATILQPSISYNMICDEFNKNWKEIKHGVLTGCEKFREVNSIELAYNIDYKWLKCIIFKPSEIKFMNWSVGQHFCKPVGNVKVERIFHLFLLHYHYMGLNWTLERYNKYYNRTSREILGKYEKYVGQYEEYKNESIIKYFENSKIHLDFLE